MKFTIKGRITLVVGLLLFLFFAASAVSYLLTNRIEDKVSHLAWVDNPRRDAVVEMEFRLAEITRTVLAYAAHREASDLARIRRSEAEFGRSALAFMRLAPGDRERRLGEAVIAAFKQFRVLSAEIIAVTNREHARLAPARAKMAAIDAAVAAKIGRPADRGAPGATDKIEALLGMGAGIAASIGALETYLASWEAGVGTLAEMSEAAFYRSAARYRETGLTREEQAWFAKLSADFAAATRSNGGVMELDDRKRDLLTSFGIQRQRMEALLSDRLVPLIGAARARTQRSINDSISTSLVYLLAMTALGMLALGGAAALLTKRIVRPILDVAAGADAIGGGKLEHRIEIESDDEIGALASSINRMAENRQQAEDALREMAHHDALTDLPNRTLFQVRLVEALDYARRINRMVAIHLLDLDRFKDINDTLGHLSGDILLQQVSERLTNCLRKSDTVARLGGDEFAIIQTNLLYHKDIAVLAERMNKTLAAPFEIDGESVYTGTSIGTTIFPDDGTEGETLLKNADLALYRAKQEGRNTYQLYDPQMNAEIQARKALEQDLRQALEHDGFFLNYQPQLELSSGRIVGIEALVRWRHPERGMVPPAEFIPVAEQSGLISRLTEGVLRDACKQAKAWQDAGLPRLRISVNLSPSDFKRKDIVLMVSDILEECRLDPEWLELEITEGMVMSGAGTVVATLDELHALGVELAIDDFGTGFSSMSYLKQFPVDRLKIDQTFVRDLLTNKEDASITNVIINLGHSLGLKVVAEGVESEEQLAFLRERNCDEAQGYCISRPLSADAFAAFISTYAPDSTHAGVKAVALN